MDLVRIEKAISASPKWREVTETITAATKRHPLTQKEKDILTRFSVLVTILSDQNVFRIYADELYNINQTS